MWSSPDHHHAVPPPTRPRFPFARRSSGGGTRNPPRVGRARLPCTRSCCSCWRSGTSRPKVVHSITIESQLAGSPDGLLDGDQLKGGSNGTPTSLAGELAELEVSASTAEPEITSPADAERPLLTLAQPSLTPMSARRFSLSDSSGAARAGRAGNGVAGNWGAGDGKALGWPVSATGEKRFAASRSRSAIRSSP